MTTTQEKQPIPVNVDQENANTTNTIVPKQINLPEKEEKKSACPFGRPREYEEYIPIYCKALLKHYENGGSLSTFQGFLLQYLKKTMKYPEEKAFKMLPGSTTIYEWANPESRYYNKDFSDTAKHGSVIADFFWQDVAIKDKNINASKYQLLMANRYRWKVRHDTTTDDQKIPTPQVYMPQKYPEAQVLNGEIVEDKQLP